MVERNSMEQEITDEGEQEQLDPVKLKNARITVVVLNILSVIVGVLGLISKLSPSYGFIVFLLVPTVAVAVYRRNTDYILFTSRKSEKRYGIFFTIIWASLLVFFGGTSGFKRLNENSLIFPSILFGSIFSMFLAYKNPHFIKEGTINKMNLLFGIAICLGLGYGLSVLYNLSGQVGEIQSSRAVISSKYIEKTHSRSGTYYHERFRLQNWQFGTFCDDIRVSRSLYGKCEVYDTLAIDIYTGRLNTQWYKIRSYKKYMNADEGNPFGSYGNEDSLARY
ncbi:MAG: hypothetical protein JWO06_3141 [Bacteroidota bacterium]|nr:hypothetical protein [Bacteroidota bacterium]